MADKINMAYPNPFRPGAGHRPPYLAGRKQEFDEFKRLLRQTVILENMVLTGLRGVGKTVLLEGFKPLAIQQGWLWVGTDLSEAASLSDDRIVTRLLADLAVATASFVVDKAVGVGFRPKGEETRLDYQTLVGIYAGTPGLAADKLKAVLEIVWRVIKGHAKGIIFAYDEAQNLSDHAAAKEFPLSLILDVFQSIQRKDIPFMLVLCGLPTLFPKLVEARTFAERMFRVVTVDRLDEKDSKEAIVKPIQDTRCPVSLTDESVLVVIKESGGYPYFIQFVCRELFDIFLQQIARKEQPQRIPLEAITKKLDTDFFAGRWARITDRQRELLLVVATLSNSDGEFAVQEIVEQSRTAKENGDIEKAFTASHVSQMLATLCEAGLIYKNRHGRYSLAVPLLDRFILRQAQERPIKWRSS
jgi:hypothetical protein